MTSTIPNRRSVFLPDPAITFDGRAREQAQDKRLPFFATRPDRGAAVYRTADYIPVCTVGDVLKQEIAR